MTLASPLEDVAATDSREVVEMLNESGYFVVPSRDVSEGLLIASMYKMRNSRGVIGMGLLALSVSFDCSSRTRSPTRSSPTAWRYGSVWQRRNTAFIRAASCFM